MKTDVLIIGGGPAGIVTAVTAKQNYPEKKIVVVRKEQRVAVPCGIPYIFGTLRDVEKNLIPDSVLTSKGIEILVDEIVDVDTEKKIAKSKEHGNIEFEKLIFATGSKPIKPPIKGIDGNNVFFVKKDPQYLQELLKRVDESEGIVIIGGGFIGVEFADELRKLGKKVSIVEMLPHVLSASFDDEFCEMAEEELRRTGVEIYTNSKVVEIKENRVILSSGKEIPGDIVIVSVGARPNTDLAEKIGLKVSKNGIMVDEYMRTSHPDIFAVGDCAEKRDFFTRDVKPVMLASVATAEARIAGANLYKIKAFKQFKGTLGIFATKVGNLALGAAGLIERQAKKDGFDYVVGRSEVADKHPGTLPGTNKVRVKLLFTKQGGFFLGAQIAGGDTIGEMINLVGFAIESGYTASRYMTLQIGTHPLLTPAPTAPATLKAAEDALMKIYRGK
ncbi:MAG: FAD-dependent oxidoreductase [Thermoplasmata archaeon]|nr:FAD-dependent oxidoreductase [Thermoplasmata archaeon]